MKARNLEPTAILDYRSESVRVFADSIVPAGASPDFLQAAHESISERILPIYSIREFRPASATIRRGQGSCSQRLACLEALARLRGIGTRVRGLWLSGRFWHRRFPLSRWFIPRRILLAWPQFAMGESWLSVEEIYAPLEELSRQGTCFTNDMESLFEAVRSTAVDFDGRLRMSAPHCDLSRYVLEDAGVFDARDDLFRRFGSLERTMRGKAFERLIAKRRLV